MKYLDYCQKHALDPFAPESKAAHHKAQRSTPRVTVKGWLRTLRKLDAEVIATSNRLTHVRQLDDGMQLKGHEPTDLSLLQSRADAAQAAFDAHAAERPELAAEYLQRAQVAELQGQLRSIVLNPPEPKPAPDPAPLALRALQATQRADALQAEAARLTQGVVPLDEEWQAFHANPLNGPGYQRDRLEERLRDAGERALAACKRAELAHDQAARLQSRAEATMSRHTAYVSAVKQRETSILLAHEHQARLRAELAQARAKLPATEAAPLTEARIRKPQTAALGERYVYDPATRGLTKLSTGKPVTTNTVMVHGVRYTIAQVVEAIGPPALGTIADPTSFNVYDLI